MIDITCISGAKLLKRKFEASKVALLVVNWLENLMVLFFFYRFCVKSRFISPLITGAIYLEIFTIGGTEAPRSSIRIFSILQLEFIQGQNVPPISKWHPQYIRYNYEDNPWVKVWHLNSNRCICNYLPYLRCLHRPNPLQ